MADTKLQQLVINVGTTAQIEAGISGGTITQDMLSISTDGANYLTQSDVVSTYSATGTAPVNGTAIKAGLDTITIPTVNNSTITITQGGVTKGSFTLNQSTGDTIALDAGGGGGSYTAGTGIDITNDVISVTSPTLTNKSTNSNSLTILGTATTANNATNIGKDSSASVPGVAVGGSSSISGSNWPSVYGFGATAENSFCGVAIGSYAKVTANNAIQIGGSNTTTASVNSTANTMSVYNGIDNYRLLNSDGTIPSARYDKSTISGYGMPSSSYDDLTLGASGATYEAPANGYFTIAKLASATNQHIYMGGRVATQIWSSFSGQYLQTFLPAEKGQEVEVSYTAGGSLAFFRFYYCKGEV